MLLGRKLHFDRSVTPRDLAAVERVLKRLGLEKLALRETAELSGGELQINHLDIRNQLETMSILREITREMNLLTIAVLHDLTIALRYVDRFVLLKDGALHACGDRRVMTQEANPRSLQNARRDPGD